MEENQTLDREQNDNAKLGIPLKMELINYTIVQQQAEMLLDR